MSNINKIQRIIDLFLYDEEFKFWKIKTKITSIIDNFFNRYTSIPNKDKQNCVVLFNNDNTYKIMCNNYNVTPSSEQEKWVSKSAMRQYIDILEAFNILKESEDAKTVYVVIDEDFLNSNMNFESSKLTSRIIDNFHNLEKQPKKIFYSVLVSYLATMVENENEVLKLKSKNGGNTTIKAIKKYAQNCGYNFMQNEFYKYGTDLEDIYETILKMISKR
ncbi:hypothetical protein [Spiroplasma sp. BIUS-1]|uniref:hypothetical protein n=1 Tax=Spiroplasma sp. BIUS-1 TaxID=216964 RepID=UPI00139939A4|nr:hypothetical protein [Spiroplasma sp. BIUS-1]QHX36775.1 hypothetical protein SBIUS_v1c05220 [Spiroplasma sp. BIUS-1]